MTKGRVDPALVRRHLLALDRAVTQLQRHVGRPETELLEDLDYLDVDVRRLHALLNGQLQDFREFAEHVESWLEQREG